MSETGLVSVRITRQFTEETADGKVTYKVGDFYEVDNSVATEWADELDVAERKTADEWKADKQATLEKERKEKLRNEVASQRSRRISVQVHDPLENDETGGWGPNGFGHFCRDVAYGCRKGNPEVSDKLKAWNSHSKTNAVTFDDSQGGYLVPPVYLNELFKNSLEATVAVSRCRQIPMETNRVNIPAVAVTSHESTLFGGITLYRPGEDEIKTASKPTFRQLELTAHKLIGLVNVSDELIEDSPSTIGAIMNGMFTEAIAYHSDRDVLRGTGVNEPLGVLNAGALVAQAIEVGQAADTVVFENIVNMWSRMYPPSMGNAVWLCNQAVLPQLYRMGLAVGTGGSSVFMPAGGVSGSMYATLMGRPLIPTEKLPVLGDQGDILLADFSQYVCANKGGIKSDVSMHLYFNYDRQTFRYVFRGDGQPLWNSALTPNDGGATLSPFVVLAERA